MSHAVGMIEMGGDTCLTPFIDIQSFVQGSPLVNLGTAGSKFHWLPQPGGGPVADYWVSSWFPETVAFPYGNEWPSLASQISDFGGASLNSPMTSTWEIGPGGIAFTTFAYYDDFETPNQGYNLWTTIYDFDGYYIEFAAYSKYQGAAPIWYAECTSATWSPGDVVSCSYDPDSGDGYVYVNNTRFALTVTAGGASGIPGPTNYREQFAASDFNFNGLESGFIPPERWTVSIGMASGTASDFCTPDPLAPACHFITWTPPAVSGDGRIHNLNDTSVSGVEQYTIDNNSFANNLILRQEGETPCDNPGATYLITTGDWGAAWDSMAQEIGGDVLAGTSVSELWIAFARVGAITVRIQMSISVTYKPLGLSGVDWGVNQFISAQFQTSDSTSLGAYTNLDQTDYYDGSLNVPAVTGAGAAVADSLSGVAWFFGSDGSSSIALGPRQFSFTSGSTLVNARTNHSSVGSAWGQLGKWDGIVI